MPRSDLANTLDQLARDEIVERANAGAVVLLPVGALEQHGAHLPVGTDSLLVSEVCRCAARLADRDAMVLPTLWAGFSPHHVPFGATVTVRAETLLALLRDILASLSTWIDHVLIVNGHGGNRGLLTVLQLETGVRSLSYWELAADAAGELFAADNGSIGHAGQAETSMMLALSASLVGRPESGFVSCTPGDELFVPELGPAGVIGNAATGDAESGRRFMAICAERLAAVINNFG